MGNDWKGTGLALKSLPLKCDPIPAPTPFGHRTMPVEVFPPPWLSLWTGHSNQVEIFFPSLVEMTGNAGQLRSSNVGATVKRMSPPMPIDPEVLQSGFAGDRPKRDLRASRWKVPVLTRSLPSMPEAPSNN